MAERHWIAGAIKHHGVFRAAAKRAGMSTEAYAHKHEHASGVLGHRARLALTLMHLNHHDEANTPQAKFNRKVDHASKRP